MGSMHDIWQALGVPADSDALAIKRAYAARLRLTRPDDDAQAYQQLREAYERALASAHARRASSPVGDSAEPVTPQPAVPPSASEPPAPPAAAPSTADAQTDTATPAEPDWVEPGALAQQLHQHWKQHGDEALIQAWPRLRVLLGGVPLSLRDDSARWFAELVLQNDDLPGEFVALLAGHFEWMQDFRVERVLGAARAAALAERLASGFVAPIRDPAMLAQYDDVLTLHKLLDDARRQAHWRPFKGWLFAALAHPASMAGRLHATPPKMLRALGIDLPFQAQLRKVAAQAGWIKWGLLMLCLSLVPMASSKPEIEWFFRAFMLAVTPVLGLALNSMFSEIRGGLKSGGRWLWFERHRDTPAVLAVGALCFAAALTVALLGRYGQGIAALMLHSPWWPLAWLLCMAVGGVLSWPRGREWEYVVLPVALLAGSALMQTQPDSEPASLAVAASGAALWLALCNAVLVQRQAELTALIRAPWRSWLPRTTLGRVALVVGIKFVAALAIVAIALTLPLMLLVNALSFGWVFVWAGAVTAVTLSATGYLGGNSAQLLLAAVAVALALGWMQRGAARLSGAAWFRSPASEKPPPRG